MRAPIAFALTSFAFPLVLGCGGGSGGEGGVAALTDGKTSRLDLPTLAMQPQSRFVNGYYEVIKAEHVASLGEVTYSFWHDPYAYWKDLNSLEWLIQKGSEGTKSVVVGRYKRDRRNGQGEQLDNYRPPLSWQTDRFLKSFEGGVHSFFAAYAEVEEGGRLYDYVELRCLLVVVDYETIVGYRGTYEIPRGGSPAFRIEELVMKRGPTPPNER